MHCVLQPSLYPGGGGGGGTPSGSSSVDFNGFGQSIGNSIGNSCSSGSGSGSASGSDDHDHDHDHEHSIGGSGSGSELMDTNSPSPTLSTSSVSFSIPSPISGQLGLPLPLPLTLPLPLVPSPTSISFSSHFSTTTGRKGSHSSNYALKPLNLCSTPDGGHGTVSGVPGGINPNETLLPIECGPNAAILYLSKLCQGSKGRCIAYNGYWLTPNQFQNICGRETAKDWKRSIRHNGKSLKLLISKGVLRVHSPICDCSNQGRHRGLHGIHQHQIQQYRNGRAASGAGSGTHFSSMKRRFQMGLQSYKRRNMELLSKHGLTRMLTNSSQPPSNNRNRNRSSNYSFSQREQVLQSQTMNELQNPSQTLVASATSKHTSNNANNASGGSVKRETRLTSIIDHLLISRANEEYRSSSSSSASSTSSNAAAGVDQLMLSEGSTANAVATSPSAVMSCASLAMAPTASSSSPSLPSGGGCGYDMRNAGAMEVTTTGDIYEDGDCENCDDEHEGEDADCGIDGGDEVDEADADADGAGGAKGSEPSSLTSSSTCRDRESTSMSPSPKTNRLSLAASTDSVDEDQGDRDRGEKQSLTASLMTAGSGATRDSSTKSGNGKSSSKKRAAPIKNERQSPESVRSSPSPPESNNNNTTSSKGAAGGDGGPPSPPLKQMEQMMSRNYSDFMRSLAAKYNHANPNEGLYPAARSSSFSFDTRFLKPGAAAAAASLLAFQQQQQQQAADKIPFPLIDMSSTQTLLSMVRSAAVAAANNTSPTHGSSSGSNSRSTPNGGSTSLPTTPPILTAGGGLKRPSSPLDLSSAAGGAGPGSLLMGNSLGSAAAASLFLNQSAAAAATSALLSLPTPKKSKQAKRCGSSCSGCSSEADSISSWTIDDVCSFVSSIDLCAEYVQAFRDHSIDGTSLPLLTEEHLIQNMNMKLGPALKFKSSIAKKLGNCPVCVHCIHCHMSPETK